MNTPNVIGVEGQPGRIGLPSQDEREAAYHEAGHAVFSQILSRCNILGRAAIFERAGGNWGGFVGKNSSRREFMTAKEASTARGSRLPDITATMPLKWQRDAEQAWQLLLMAFAGPAAEQVLNNQSIGAWHVRYHYSASGDRGLAENLAGHFWPDEVFDEIVDRAAETAGAMCCLPDVWAAIQDVAKFLLDHGRHQSSIYETSVIVRNRIPQPIHVPFQEQVVSQRRKQP